jgi:MFS transporter, FLVCR family, MFS-domain-containing protein 7
LVFHNGEGAARKRFESLLFYQNVAATLSACLLLIIMEEAPAIPPSHSSIRSEQKLEIRQVVHQLRQNPDFFLLMVMFALLLGVFQTFGAMMGSIFAPFGLGPSKIAFYGALLLFSGIIVSPMVCSLVGKIKHYRTAVRLLVCTLTLTFLNVIFLIQQIDVHGKAFAIAMMVCGACAVSFIPVCLDFAIETAFPV